MKVKNEIPTGSVTWINGIGSPIPRWWTTLSRLRLNHPAYLNQPAGTARRRRSLSTRPAGPTPPRTGGPGDLQQRAQRGYREEEHEPPVPPSVEHVAGDENEHAPALGKGASSQLPTKTIRRRLRNQLSGTATGEVLRARSGNAGRVYLRPTDDTYPLASTVEAFSPFRPR